jgi:hypothetical protein
MRVFVDTNLTSGESVMLLVPGSTTVGELKVGIGWEEAKYRGYPESGVVVVVSSSSWSWSRSTSTSTSTYAHAPPTSLRLLLRL